MNHGPWIVRVITVLLATALISCAEPVSDATKHFDAAFWQVWFMEMSEEDRELVCWERTEEAAEDYAIGFDAGYIGAKERAQVLFAKACEPYKARR